MDPKMTFTSVAFDNVNYQILKIEETSIQTSNLNKTSKTGYVQISLLSKSTLKLKMVMQIKQKDGLFRLKQGYATIN